MFPFVGTLTEPAFPFSGKRTQLAFPFLGTEWERDIPSRGTKENIKKVKNRLYRKQDISLKAFEGASATSMRRILNIDLELKPYEKIIELSLSDDQKIKRKQFANWLRTNFRKKDILKILFSDEKCFDIDSVYNSENESV